MVNLNPEIQKTSIKLGVRLQSVLEIGVHGPSSAPGKSIVTKPPDPHWENGAPYWGSIWIVRMRDWVEHTAKIRELNIILLLCQLFSLLSFDLLTLTFLIIW